MSHAVQTAGGRTYLHVWRGGRSYERQKGPIYRSEWNNLRFTLRAQPEGETQVLHHDVRTPLPYPPETFDAVYLFHIIEHLTPEEAPAFLGEVKRITKPGGIVRLSTPDLEGTARAYLERLEDHEREPSFRNRIRYEWSVLELFDQVVRTRPGGRLSEFKQAGRFDEAYAHERYSDVFDEFYVPPAGTARAKKSAHRPSTLRRAARFVRRRLSGRGSRGELPSSEALQKLRRSGELILWLYDRFSLAVLLTTHGFQLVRQVTYKTSDIPEWERFDLDRSTAGDYPIEPSLYMEARRPL